jgi:DNA-binding PadR family transcriptional regulator
MFGQRHQHHPFSGGRCEPDATPGRAHFWAEALGPWGRSRRARRGDIRLAILSVLADGPRHGYEIMRDLEARSGGRWRPSPGSVYPTLQLLEDEGLVQGEEVDGRRVFSISEAGRQEIEARSQPGGWCPPWEVPDAGGGVSGVWEAALGLLMAARQVAAAGTADQHARALELLQDTRRKLYSILGEA